LGMDGFTRLHSALRILYSFSTLLPSSSDVILHEVLHQLGINKDLTVMSRA